MRILPTIFVLSLLTACSAVPTAASNPPAPAGPVAQEPKAEAPKTAEADKQKAEAKKQKQKELRNKQRELALFRIEQQTAELDRKVRTMGVEATLLRTASELDLARRNLDLFLNDQRARELEDRRISLDYSVHRADHAKDELGELEAMYQADEFAKTTKELVLKRGRRELEMAERSLAVARKATAEFEQHTLPQRERELRQKVADAENERRKAEIDATKAQLEQQIADQKQKDRLADLEEDIAELQQALAKEST